MSSQFKKYENNIKCLVDSGMVIRIFLKKSLKNISIQSIRSNIF